MIKQITTLILLAVALTAHSQTTDSVSTGSSNANDVYYSFTNGIVKSQPNNDWDLAFEITGFTASILANHVKGLMVWQSPYSYSKWANLDTAGFKTWKKMYNSPQSWSLGAFNLHNNNNGDPYDLGWGTYDPSTHIVAGDSIFIIKLATGDYKKITILNLSSGIYNIKYSNIDGSGEKISSIDKANFKGKNFAYYSFTTETTIDREPATSDWDVVFTKYTDFIPTPYNVGGIWTNKGYTTAEARNVATTIKDFSPYRFSDTNSVIGYDWKTYNQSLNKYIITDNLVYFIKTKDANWKIVFTGYKGGASGTYYFSKQAVTASSKSPKLTTNTVYPNPANGILNLRLSPDNSLINYKIINILGQLAISGTETIVDISTLNSGIYFIQLLTDKGIQNLKFTKTSL